MGVLGAVLRAWPGCRATARKSGKFGAHVVHDLEHITVIADEPLPFQVDGDALETREKVRFRSVPNALRVVGAPPESILNQRFCQVVRETLDRAASCRVASPMGSCEDAAAQDRGIAEIAATSR